jgi:amidohydrolase
LKEKIRQLSAQIADWVIDIRRDLHAHPEIGLQETRTPVVVAEHLEKLGLEVKTGVGATGVVGLLKGGKPGRVLAIRADMDALPIKEETGLPFASKNDGVMHACGHDAHVAMALGAARVLSELREHICGTIKFVIQPAEENLGGAIGMVEEGVLENPKVDAIAALHVETHEEVGTLAIKSGPVGASADVFMVSVNGKGGHGSEPQDCIDPIHIAAHIVTAFQTMIPRTLDVRDPVVVSVCSIQAGSAFNIIPDNVHFGGTVRTLSRKRREEMPRKMEDIVRGITGTFGATYDFSYIFGAPVTSNEPGITDLMRDVTRELWGADALIEKEKPSMGSEDYSYYLEKVPGAMGFLGAGPPAERRFPAHHPKFDIDERCLTFGVEFHSATAIKFLNGKLS